MNQPATQLDIFYLTLAVVGLIVVLISLPTLVHGPKRSARKATAH